MQFLGICFLRGQGQRHHELYRWGTTQGGLSIVSLSAEILHIISKGSNGLVLRPNTFEAPLTVSHYIFPCNPAYYYLYVAYNNIVWRYLQGSI